MLKLIFWSLLAINAVLFAYGKGYLGNFKGEEREPARLKNQLHPDKLKLITPGTRGAAAAATLSASQRPWLRQRASPWARPQAPCRALPAPCASA